MKFTRINTPCMYGYEATDGEYRVEVVRADVGEWYAWLFRGRFMIIPTNKPSDLRGLSFRDAMKDGSRLLKEARL